MSARSSQPQAAALARLTWPLRVAVVPLAIVAGAGCTPSAQQPGAQSPERQSDAEYDVARDSFQRGSPREALDHVQKAITLHPENGKAHYLKAAILLGFCSGPRGFGEPDCKLGEVESSARLALKHNPEFRDAKNLLGQVLINEKKHKEAISVLEPLTRDPAYLHPYLAWGNLGWAQVLDGQLDAGIASLKNAVTEPRFCVGHYRLGIALERRGDVAQAEQSLTTALSVEDPQCTGLQDAWESRGRLRFRLGRMGESRADYERCVELSKETETGKTCVLELARLVEPAASKGTNRGSSEPNSGAR
jgi:type IV pilus assembly protein PilF